MMNKRTALFLLLSLSISLSWSSCNTSKNATSVTEPAQVIEEVTKGNEWPSEEDYFLKIRRSPCLGQCPVYEAVIFNQGTVRFDGWQFTDRQGRHRAEGGTSLIEQIRALTNAIGFYSMLDEYPSGDMRIMDMSTTLLTLKDGDMEKTIQNHNYANIQVPGEEETVKSLMQFANQVDSIFNTLEWDLIEAPQDRQ